MSGLGLARFSGAVRRRLYFDLQRAIGSRIGATWHEFQAWTRLSATELTVRTEILLDTLTAHAMTNVEFYRKLGLRRGSGETAHELLARFPILTRADVQASFSSLVSDAMRQMITSPASQSRSLYDWTTVKTGGTTGLPTTVVHDRQCRDWGRTTRVFSQRQCGFPLGTPYFRLWGSEAELFQTSTRIDRRILSGLLGEIPMNAFRSDATNLRKHLGVLAAHPHVHHMMAYVDTATSLAELIVDEKLCAPPLKSIMACAGNVTPYARALLQRVFGAEIYDKYGSRECSDIACECGQHDGLHINSPSVYVEIVDDDNRPCAPGVSGRVVITMLRNQMFPMIRYEIGDLASWRADAACACGLPFPRLASIEGRIDDRLLAGDGTWISAAFIRHFVGVSLNQQLIRDWQFEQHGPREFTFRFVARTSDGLAENVGRLVRSFAAVLGEEAFIRVEQRQEILGASDKRRWVINSYRRDRSLAG